jgi:phage tail sheath protein FI
MAKKSKKKGKRRRSSYLTPGVYVEEVSSGSRPIEAVGTSIAAFVGLAPLKPARLATTALLAGLLAWAVRTRRG